MSKTLLSLFIASLFLTATALAEHSHHVMLYPGGVNSNTYTYFYLLVEIGGNSDDDVHEIILEIPTSGGEADFEIDDYSLVDGIPRQAHGYIWFMPESMAEYDEEDNYVKIAYVANSPYQLRPGDAVAFTFKAKTPKDEDRYSFYVTTIDSQGDEEETTARVIVDDQPPEITISGAPSTWRRQKARARLLCYDNGDPASGCNYSTYRFYQGDECPSDYALYTLESPFEVTTHSWLCAAAMDKAFNIGFAGPVEFRIDTSKPEAIVTLPAPESWREPGFFVTLRYSDEVRSGLSTCYYRVSEYKDSWKPVTVWKKENCSGDLEIFLVRVTECKEEGENTCKIEAYAVDNTGNRGETFSTTFSIDYHGPEGELISLRPSTEIEGRIYLNGIVEILGNASDESLEAYSLYTNDKLVHSSNESVEEGLLAEWNTERTTDGNQSLILVVRDLTGKEKRAKWDVVIDNTSPETRFLLSEDGSNASLEAAEPGENHSGTDSTYYRLYERWGEAGEWEYYGEPFPLPSEPGEYFIEYYSVDRLGNEERVKRESFTIEQEERLAGVTGMLFSGGDLNVPTAIVVMIILVGMLRIFALIHEIKVTTNCA